MAAAAAVRRAMRRGCISASTFHAATCSGVAAPSSSLRALAANTLYHHHPQHAGPLKRLPPPTAPHRLQPGGSSRHPPPTFVAPLTLHRHAAVGGDAHARSFSGSSTSTSKDGKDDEGRVVQGVSSSASSNINAASEEATFFDEAARGSGGGGGDTTTSTSTSEEEDTKKKRGDDVWDVMGFLKENPQVLSICCTTGKGVAHLSPRDIYCASKHVHLRTASMVPVTQPDTRECRPYPPACSWRATPASPPCCPSSPESSEPRRRRWA